MGIYVIKVRTGKEKNIVDEITSITEEKGLAIYSAIVLPNLKGYIVVEGEESDVNSVISSITDARRNIGSMKLSELEGYFTEKEEIINIEVGDTVLVLRGSFKNDNATVKSINLAKKECTVELQNTFVSIPLTLKLQDVKKIEKEV